MDTDNLSEHFDFKQCWTCHHLVLDISDRRCRCTLTGRTFDKNSDIVSPTGCEEWTDDHFRELKKMVKTNSDD